jgi:O-antigen/teichoic acid export membrane protein
MLRLLSNTLTNITGRGLGYIVRLILIAFLVRQFGKPAFGLVALAEGLILNKDLFESAFGISTTKYIAEYSTSYDIKRIRCIINANYILTFVGALLFCMALVLFNHFYLISFFSIPQDFVPQITIFVDLFIAGVFFDFFQVTLTRISEGFQDYVTARMISLSKNFLWLILSIAFVLFISEELVVVGWAYFFASFLSFLLGCVILYSKYQVIGLRFGCLQINVLKKMFAFSGWLYLSKFSTILSRRANIFIIAYFLDVSALAYYQIAYQLCEILTQGRSLITSALIPFSSKLKSLDDKDGLIQTFNFLTKLSVYVISTSGIFLFLRIDRVITLWVGEGTEPSYIVAQIMIVAIALSSLTNVGIEMMIGMNKLKKLVKCTMAFSLINVTLVLFLIHFLGITGIAIAGLVSRLFLVSVYLPIIMHALELKPADFLDITSRRGLMFFLVIYGLCLYGISNLWISCAIYLLMLISFWFFMETDEKQVVMNMIHPKIRVRI